MTPGFYLQRLTSQLIDGVDRLPADYRERHGRWLRAQQNPDGGFSGREGGSDLYYTAFALRGLAVVQHLDEAISTKAASFLESRFDRVAGIVDLFSLLVSTFLVRMGGGPDVLADAPADWPQRIAGMLETFRHADGGYMKAPGGVSGSTYTTFLVALALELLQQTIPQPERTVQFLESRYREGGYVEIPQMKRAGTNPTAAGIGTLQILGAQDAIQKTPSTEFLLNLQSDFEGGLRANDRIPAADLLSTFTGSWTLAELGGLAHLEADNVQEYAVSLESPEGGYRGGLWDNGYDVEYTFYGIGVMGLFAPTTAG